MSRLSSLVAPLLFTLLLAATTVEAVPLRAGELLVSTEFGELFRVDAATGAYELFASIPARTPTGRLAFDDAGHVLVRGGADSAYRVDRNTGAVSLLASGGYLDQQIVTDGIAFDPRLGLVLDTRVQVGPSSFHGRVVQVDASGTQHLLFQASYLPRGLAVEPSGSIVVASNSVFLDGVFYGGGLFRIDPETGGASVVSSGGLLSSPTDVEVASDGTIFVLDRGISGSGGLLAVDPVTGAQSVMVPSIWVVLYKALGMTADGAGGFYLTVAPSAVDDSYFGGVVHFTPGDSAPTAVTDLQAFFNPWDVAVVPVPEPGVLALLAIGCTALGARRPPGPRPLPAAR